MIVYTDMDDVLCDYSTAFNNAIQNVQKLIQKTLKER